MKNEFINATPEQKNAVIAWRDAAIADGWTMEPSYACESADRACRLTREGFIAQILTREPKGKESSWYSIHAWAPDRLALEIPLPYSWESLQANILLCDQCHEFKTDIGRVGFANRVCADCRPAAAKRIEFPGWTS